jgi:hypothetical protein
VSYPTDGRTELVYVDKHTVDMCAGQADKRTNGQRTDCLNTDTTRVERFIILIITSTRRLKRFIRPKSNHQTSKGASRLLQTVRTQTGRTVANCGSGAAKKPTLRVNNQPQQGKPTQRTKDSESRTADLDRIKRNHKICLQERARTQQH